jgi:two-component system, OmpR family, response regulator MprA
VKPIHSDEAAAPCPPTGRASKAHILVVDDLAANVRVLQSLLVEDGYTVSVASDGEQALAAVAREQPDLVLLDIVMPKIDGTTRRPG